MPFSGGTYTPPPPPAFPPVAGNVISSAYYIEVINDIASALSLTFLRDGSLAFTGDLDLGNNGIKNLGAGTAGAPSLRFNDDIDTGWFLAGIGRLAASVNGVNRLEITDTTFKSSILAPVSITYAASITPDCNLGSNFTTTLTGNITINNFANENIGSSGLIRIIQDGTGSRVATWGTDWLFPFGIDTLSTAAGSVDLVFYFIYDSTHTYAAIVKAYS